MAESRWSVTPVVRRLRFLGNLMSTRGCDAASRRSRLKNALATVRRDASLLHPSLTRAGSTYTGKSVIKDQSVLAEVMYAMIKDFPLLGRLCVWAFLWALRLDETCEAGAEAVSPDAIAHVRTTGRLSGVCKLKAQTVPNTHRCNKRVACVVASTSDRRSSDRVRFETLVLLPGERQMFCGLDDILGFRAAMSEWRTSPCFATKPAARRTLRLWMLRNANQLNIGHFTWHALKTMRLSYAHASLMTNVEEPPGSGSYRARGYIPSVEDIRRLSNHKTITMLERFYFTQCHGLEATHLHDTALSILLRTMLGEATVQRFARQLTRLPDQVDEPTTRTDEQQSMDRIHVAEKSVQQRVRISRRIKHLAHKVALSQLVSTTVGYLVSIVRSSRSPAEVRVAASSMLKQLRYIEHAVFGTNALYDSKSKATVRYTKRFVCNAVRLVECVHLHFAAPRVLLAHLHLDRCAQHRVVSVTAVHALAQTTIDVAAALRSNKCTHKRADVWLACAVTKEVCRITRRRNSASQA